MSILNRTIVAFALVIMKLSICDAATENGRRPQEPRPPYPYYAEEVVFDNEKARCTTCGNAYASAV